MTSSLWCDACVEGRHGDCIRLWECTCYAYDDAHKDSPPLPVTRNDRDLTILRRWVERHVDGGLGSGRWLMGEMP